MRISRDVNLRLYVGSPAYSRRSLFSLRISRRSNSVLDLDFICSSYALSSLFDYSDECYPDGVITAFSEMPFTVHRPSPDSLVWRRKGYTRIRISPDSDIAVWRRVVNAPLVEYAGPSKRVSRERQ
jgi:hypothetical protein